MENKAVGAPLHKFIGAFRFGLKAALNRASVEGEFGTLAGASDAGPQLLRSCGGFTVLYRSFMVRVYGGARFDCCCCCSTLHAAHLAALA